MLAYHYERGEMWEKALQYLVKVGQEAQQIYANQEAIDHEAGPWTCEQPGGGGGASDPDDDLRRQGGGAFPAK